jgi:formylglycine-generating enzyme required for sulfatase activity
MTLPKTLKVAALTAAANLLVATADAKLDFVKDVKPVLEQNCVGCHNDKHADENGNYSMETKAGAFKPHGNKQRISPSHPDESQVYALTQRPIDDDKVMPPKERPRPTKQELDTIKTWIAEGADWPEGVTLRTPVNFMLGVLPILEKGGPISDTDRRDLKTWLDQGAYWPAGVKLAGAKPMPKTTTGAKVDFAHDVLPILSNGGPLSSEDVATLQDWVNAGAQWPETIQIGGGGLKAQELRRVEAIRKKVLAVSNEKSWSDMKPYTNTIPESTVNYAMIPIREGEYRMGSPESEPKSAADEHPQHKVKVEPFWIEQKEVTWNEYELWMYPDETKPHSPNGTTNYTDGDVADAVSRPTKPYVEMSFGMGKDGFPAISMTQHAANKYCEWLSAKTGHFYRLPTEAEWEYACRAGTTTAYSFGDDPAKLGEYAWFGDNSDLKYQKVGKKKPNPWGLFDMHGNVAEWCLDQYDPDYYKQFAGKVTTDPWNVASKPYPHSVRGGSWSDDADRLRSAARTNSVPAWKMQDPQLPKSIWYLTDAQFVGFRIIRPLKVPSAQEMYKYWNSGVEKE